MNALDVSPVTKDMYTCCRCDMPARFEVLGDFLCDGCARERYIVPNDWADYELTQER